MSRAIRNQIFNLKEGTAGKGGDPIQTLVDEYKTLVEADGGTIKNETDTYAAFSAIVASGEINTLWGYYVPAAGSKLTVSDYVTKAYSLVGTSFFVDRYGNYARPVLYDTVNKKWVDSNVSTDSRGKIEGIGAHSGNFRLKTKAVYQNAGAVIFFYNAASQIVYRLRLMTTTGKLEFLRYNAGVSIGGATFDSTIFSGVTEFELFINNTTNEGTLNGETKSLAGTFTDSVEWGEFNMYDTVNNEIEYIKISKA